MSQLLFLVAWSATGWFAASWRIPSERRHITWNLAGLIFRPLWAISRHDRARLDQRVEDTDAHRPPLEVTPHYPGAGPVVAAMALRSSGSGAQSSVVTIPVAVATDPR